MTSKERYEEVYKAALAKKDVHTALAAAELLDNLEKEDKK